MRLTLMSLSDVSLVLGVDEGTIRNLRAQGRFAPATKVGRKLRWSEASLQKWLEDQQESSC